MQHFVDLEFENNNMRKRSALAAPIFLFDKIIDVCGHTVVTICINMEKRIYILKNENNNTNVTWYFLTNEERDSLFAKDIKIHHVCYCSTCCIVLFFFLCCRCLSFFFFVN